MAIFEGVYKKYICFKGWRKRLRGSHFKGGHLIKPYKTAHQSSIQSQNLKVSCINPEAFDETSHNCIGGRISIHINESRNCRHEFIARHENILN